MVQITASTADIAVLANLDIGVVSLRGLYAAPPIPSSCGFELREATVIDVELSHAGVTNLENQSKRAPSRCRLLLRPSAPVRHALALGGAFAS